MTYDPAQAEREAQVKVRLLTPDNCRIFKSEFDRLDCQVDGSEVYHTIYAVRMFPVRHPNRFISVRGIDENGKAFEIGLIDRLKEFPEEQQGLLRASMARQYYQQVIHRIHNIESEFGLLFFDVETQRGREQFTMPWRMGRAEDFGERGKMLHASLGNVYIVQDVEELPPADRRRFRSYVYW